MSLATVQISIEQHYTAKGLLQVVSCHDEDRCIGEIFYLSAAFFLTYLILYLFAVVEQGFDREVMLRGCIAFQREIAGRIVGILASILLSSTSARKRQGKSAVFQVSAPA